MKKLSPQQLKLAAFTPLVLFFGALGVQASPELWHAPRPQQLDQIAVLPQKIGNAGLVERWEGDRVIDGHYEQGGRYRDPARPGDVQLDVFRNTTKPHNGVYCYIVEGETLLSENVRPLQSPGQSTSFDVAVLRTRDQLRIVASTDCRASGCTATPVTPEGRWSIKWPAMSPWQAGQSARVPVSIMLSQPVTGTNESADRASLERQLTDVVARLDLAPMRELARLQGQ